MHHSFIEKNQICSQFWVQNTCPQTHTVNSSVRWLTSPKDTQRLWRFILFIAAVADPVNQIYCFKGNRNHLGFKKKTHNKLQQCLVSVQCFAILCLLSFQSITVLYVETHSECCFLFPEIRFIWKIGLD